ncbi:MAG: type 1 fimbrial protein, partial [Hafniaceae bacterium]|nr:type 1 fimbrial protein [Hafniaceae bacterium]
MQNRFALCAFLALGVVFQAQSTVPQLPQHQDRDHAGEDGGIVRFHGSVYASPCVMAGESRMQDIDMGEMTARSFHRAGDHS